MSSRFVKQRSVSGAPRRVQSQLLESAASNGGAGIASGGAVRQPPAGAPTDLPSRTAANREDSRRQSQDNPAVPALAAVPQDFRPQAPDAPSSPPESLPRPQCAVAARRKQTRTRPASRVPPASHSPPP